MVTFAVSKAWLVSPLHCVLNWEVFWIDFQVEGVASPITFARIIRPMNTWQLCGWQFSHKETLLQTFFKQRAILDGNRPFCVFEPPSFGAIGATYDDHLRLTVKRVVDVLLVLIELLSLCVTSEALLANIGWKSAISLQRGPVEPKFQAERVVPHQPFFFSEN